MENMFTVADAAADAMAVDAEMANAVDAAATTAAAGRGTTASVAVDATKPKKA